MMMRQIMRISAALLLLSAASSFGTDYSSLRDLAPKEEFTRHTIKSDLAGAAFVVPGNLVGGRMQELVVSSFGSLTYGPMGPIPPDAGQGAVVARGWMRRHHRYAIGLSVGLDGEYP